MVEVCVMYSDDSITYTVPQSRSTYYGQTSEDESKCKGITEQKVDKMYNLVYSSCTSLFAPSSTPTAKMR